MNLPVTHPSKAKRLNIQAAVLRKAGKRLKIEPLVMEGPEDEEVLVRVVASGICHTDISFCDDWDENDMPVVLGHEGAGVVEEVGRGVKGLNPGDHVVLSYQSCGHCGPCRKGRLAHCIHLYDANFGFMRLNGSNALGQNGVRGHFFGQSSFSTYALATERNIVVVPKNLSLEILAPLGCSMQTGAGTVMNSLKVANGKSLAVFGTGAVGMAAVMAARIVGANPIIGVDIIPMRLRLAIELGCTHVINNKKKDIATGITGITGSGVDYVVETTGDTAMHKLAIDILNPKGKVALLTGETGMNFPGGRKTVGIIQGDSVPQIFIPRLIELYRSGSFPFDRLQKYYAFKDINRAISDAKRGIAIKPVLRIGAA
jgi:aryl-alcohol dehydrogenase